MKQAEYFLLLLLLLVSSGSFAGIQAGTLLVVNKSDNTVSLISPSDPSRKKTLTVGEGPHEIEVSPDGMMALVSNYGTAKRAGNTITVVDIPNARVSTTINLGTNRRPHGLAWIPGQNKVLVTTEDSKALLLVDIHDGNVIRSYSLPAELGHMVAVSPDARHVYVSAIASGTVTRIDLADSGPVITKFSGAGAEGIDVAPDGGTVWVTNRDEDTVSVFSTSDLSLINKIKTSGYPIRIKHSPDGSKALVTLAKAGEIAVIDTRSYSIKSYVSMRGDFSIKYGQHLGGYFGMKPLPIGLLIQPDNRLAYIANTASGTVAVVNIDTATVINTLTAGKEPDGLGYSQVSIAQ